MAVTINKTDGTVLATIEDGAIDTVSTNLALIGKLYRNYGELVNENLVKLLENFANSSSPTVPIRGQVWFDTTNKILKVYRTTGFVPLSVLSVSSAQPGTPTIGDLWFDTVDQQLKLYNNSIWIVVGPTYTSTQGKTGVFAETLRDSTSATRIVLAHYINNSIVAIQSYASDTWIPQTAISGFADIRPGLNLSVLNNQQFVGNASNAITVGNIASTSLLRNDQNGTINGSLTVSSASGLYLGPNNTRFYTDGNDTIVSNPVGNTEFWNLENKIAEVTGSTKQILVNDGNIASPSIGFISNPNTGIFQSASGNISVTSSGSLVATFSPTGLAVTGDISATGTISSANITLSGNITLGDSVSDRVTINTSDLQIPNGLILAAGNVRFDNNVGILGFANITGNANVNSNLNVTGNATVTTNLTVNGTLNFADILKFDSSQRLLLNSATPATAYTNTGDFTLGQLNVIRSFNTPKYWVSFNGTLAGLAIRDSHNVDAITRSTTNNYALTLATPLTSGAQCGVGSNGGRFNGVPSNGASSFAIVTDSESDNMGFVVYSA